MSKRIMTVEDSTSLREMISFTLGDAGYEVAQAKDGQDALAKLSEFKADLIITDLNMPNMNGIELTRSLRNNPMYRFVPIIFLTTESQVQKKQSAKEAGATGWIAKPFKPDQLLQVVRKVLG
jgi:two-component system chemotaxis response regulator CheY